MNVPPTLRFLLAKQAFACFPNMQLRHSSRRYMHKLLQAMNVPFTCMEHVQSGTQALHVGWTCKKFAVYAVLVTIILYIVHSGIFLFQLFSVMSMLIAPVSC